MLRDAHEVDVKELDELLVEVARLCARVPAVLLEDARQRPALQLPEAADERSGAVAAEVAHHQQRVRRGECDGRSLSVR